MPSLVSLSHRPHIAESPAEYTSASFSVIKEMLAECLGRVEDLPSLVRGKRVLVKPNLVRPNLVKLPASTTDPRVTVALCELLLDSGAKEVKVGENPGWGLAARIAFRDSMLEEPLKARGVGISYFDEESKDIVPNEAAWCFKNVLIPRPVLDCDTFISVPKLKTHMHTLVTLGMKNLQGIILDEQRLLFHRNDINIKIVDTVRIRVPDLTVVDGLWAMEGQAPFHGRTIPDFNVLVAGRDVVRVDVVCTQLMGYRFQEVPHVALSRQAGFSDYWDGPIPVAGADPVSLVRTFERPILSSMGAFKDVQVLEGGECQGCQSSLRHSLDKLDFEGKLAEVAKPLTVYAGKVMPNVPTLTRWEGNLVLFGNCASEVVYSAPSERNQGHFIQGCPPHIHDLAKYLEKETEK